VAKHLSHDPPVATAHDEHPRPIAPAPEETDVDRHLVIDELVRLGELHRAVKDEDPAERGVVVDLDLLELRRLPVDQSLVERLTREPSDVRPIVSGHGRSFQNVGSAKAAR
jgi:hypothetical protein